MGYVYLEPQCPKSFHGLKLDPEPDWSMDDLVSELNELELGLHSFTKNHGLELPAEKNSESQKPFVMRLSDDEIEESTNDNDESCSRNWNNQSRFFCPEFDFSGSDSSESELELDEIKPQWMEKNKTEKGALFVLEHEHQLRLKEEIRNKLSGFHSDLKKATERIASAQDHILKLVDLRWEKDRRLDMQYQRKVAEELDSHLSAVQRVHEQKSQIEERKIKTDAAFEEARKKEKAIQEENARQEMARQEKAKAEAEAWLRSVKELEVQKIKDVESASSVESRGDLKVLDKSVDTLKEVNANTSKEITPEQPNSSTAVIQVDSAEIALKLESVRLYKYNEIVEKNRELKSGLMEDLKSYEKLIARRIKQIRGNQENVREKANDLFKIINSSQCPPSIAIALFAEKVVSLCETHENLSTMFAIGQVTVILSSQFPVLMDLVLAEFNRVCIFTVPKYIPYKKSTFKTKEEYYKRIGFKEEEGKLESIANYLGRTESYMTSYAALIQTKIVGINNPHGLGDGWIWLARFLNHLPVNNFTAVALMAFLRVAGYMLFKQYKSQFKKILKVISNQFLVRLKEKHQDPTMKRVIADLETYIDHNQYLQEPEGRRPQSLIL